jgi:hypothetical protein
VRLVTTVDAKHEATHRLSASLRARVVRRRRVERLHQQVIGRLLAGWALAHDARFRTTLSPHASVTYAALDRGLLVAPRLARFRGP